MTMPATPDETAEAVIRLHAERATVARRKVETGKVRVRLETKSYDEVVDEVLTQEHVEVERVVVGRFVDVAPGIREEGDTTVISVVEEVLVVERRLVLKEEIHLRRVQTTARHQETVALREQEAVIERLDVSFDGDPLSTSSPHIPPTKEQLP